jgi:hypothetical protein
MMEKRGRTLIGIRYSRGRDESDHGKGSCGRSYGLILLGKLGSNSGIYMRITQQRDGNIPFLI